MASNNPHYTADPVEREVTPDLVKFKPRALNIVWGSDTRYWRLPADSKSSGDESLAELLQVSWLEVTGSMELEVGKKYEVGFKLSLKADAFGWSGCPVYLMAKVGKKGKYKWTKINLPDLKPDEPCKIADTFMAEEKPSSDNTLYFGLYEVWSGKWKGGLQIHYAFVKTWTP